MVIKEIPTLAPPPACPDILQPVNTEIAVKCVPNGAVELYYDNTKMFETASYGAGFTSNVRMNSDSNSLQIGAGQDLKFFHNGSNSFITNDTGGLYIRSDVLGLEDQTNGHSYLGAQADGAVTIRYDNSVKLQTTSAGVSVTGQLVASSAITANSYLQGNTSNGGFLFYSDSSASKGVILDTNDHLRPTNNNAQDLGTSSYRWANVYTNDLNISNEGGSHHVAGTWGSYTIQEGAEDLFLLNKRNGKKYKFNLTEVS